VAYTLTQALFPAFLLAGVAVGWTLTLEGLFYLLAPALLARLSHAPGTGRLMAGAAAVSVAAIGLGVLAAGLPLPAAWQGTLLGAPLEWVLHYTIFGHLPDFMAGMVAGLLFLRRGAGGPRAWMPSWGPHALIGGGVLGVYAAMLGLDTVATEYGSPLNRLLGFGVALGASLVIFGMACDERQANPLSRWLGTWWMAYLGTISYALYLVQLTEPCQWLFWILLGVKLNVSDLVLRALLLYPLASVLSAGLYHAVERPAERWLRRFGKRKRAAIAGVT
jgi:peptidoglycan/LPS O-acetylase OafA/YrhL